MCVASSNTFTLARMCCRLIRSIADALGRKFHRIALGGKWPCRARISTGLDGGVSIKEIHAFLL
jgi:hypothetical protein